MDGKKSSEEQIKVNYQAVLDRIQSAADRSSRDLEEIKLVTVTKEKSIRTLKGAVNVGMRVFGENYAEEAIPKILALSKVSDIKWHMIGHVQSRKAEIVVRYFDYMHSLDSVKLARRLDRFARQYNKIFPSLIEFNLSGEASKYGFPAWSEENWLELIPILSQILELPNIRIQGLMTIPPFSENPEQSRSYYRKLCKLQDYLQLNLPQGNWCELSMGMSSDFDVAIEEGATWVRVGQAILGRRE